MITLNQKQFKDVTKLVALAARLDELNRLEGYLPSALLSRRKGILKKQVETLEGKKDDEETSINIRIEVPGEGTKVAKKEKSFSLNLGNLLNRKFNEIELGDDDDDVFKVVKNLLPPRRRSGILGKVVTEL